MDFSRSSASILLSMFPPHVCPEGVELAFFVGSSLATPSRKAHICVCDVAGKCFVGKAATKEEAEENAANKALEGLGLAKGCQGDEVVNMADEKKKAGVYGKRFER